MIFGLLLASLARTHARTQERSPFRLEAVSFVAHVAMMDGPSGRPVGAAQRRRENSIQDGTEFYCLRQKFHPMTFWETLYKFRFRESDQLKIVLKLSDMEIHQKISMPNYQKLKTMVKKSIDQELRFRDFDARHGRIESGAVVKSRKGLTGAEGGKGVCYQWKEKGQCSHGDRFSFRHEAQDRAQKPEHTAATPSEPTFPRGRSVSRKRSSEAKATMGPFFDNRADII